MTENKWPFWVVPEAMIGDYFFKLILFLFGLPYLFGYFFTTQGLLINFALIDVIMYASYRVRGLL
tara:strand:+ start:296 stop:490 length:195 start_codon:yes stop_codon:yes gene_type:complete